LRVNKSKPHSPGSRRHGDRRVGSSDVRTSAGLTVMGQARTISGKERVSFSAAVGPAK